MRSAERLAPNKNFKYIPSFEPSMDGGCHAIPGFSEETGDYAILGIAGIRHFTCRQGHPSPSPILLFNPAPSSPPSTHSTPVLSLIHASMLLSQAAISAQPASRAAAAKAALL